MASQRYSPEFKEEAVRQIVDRGYGLASEKRTVELSPHCPVFELNGADIADISMPAFSVVEAFDVVEHIGSCFISRAVFSPSGSLSF